MAAWITAGCSACRALIAYGSRLFMGVQLCAGSKLQQPLYTALMLNGHLLKLLLHTWGGQCDCCNCLHRLHTHGNSKSKPAEDVVKSSEQQRGAKIKLDCC